MKSVVLALALLAGALCSSYAATSPTLPADAHGEIAAALFGAAETQATAQRLADADLQAAQARIAELQRKVAQGDARSRIALAAAQRKFVAELAAKDRAYAEAIAAFRNTVTGVASTPEGAAALARFNAGQTGVALETLDRLQAAEELAIDRDETIRADIKKAVGRRNNADLARDSHDRGLGPVAANVIARYESVVALDPGMTRDWVELARLYQSIGRYDDALRVIGRAVDTAASDKDRLIALGDRGAVESDLGRLDDAKRDDMAAIAIAQALLKADPADPDRHRNVGVNLAALAVVLMAENRYAEARGYFEQSLVISRELLAAYPTSAPLKRDVSISLAQVGDARAALGDAAGARAAYSEVVALDRQRVAADPEGVQAQLDLAVSVSIFATFVEGPEKIKALKEGIDILRKRAAADPTDVLVRRNLGTDMWNLAAEKGSGMKWSDVVLYFEDLERSGVSQPRDRADLDKALSMARDFAAKEAKP